MMDRSTREIGAFFNVVDSERRILLINFVSIYVHMAIGAYERNNKTSIKKQILQIKKTQQTIVYKPQQFLQFM